MSTVLDRLDQLQSFGMKLGLQNIVELLRALGHPERSFASIHVAGTNGKGSVSAMLHAILNACGYRTGLYTSPHLVDIRERIRVGQAMIPERDLEGCLNHVFSVIDSLELEGVPTYFETLTATALFYFSSIAVDYAVVEVGLGGRFDATNAIVPRVSAITTIDLDHEEHLGRSPAGIAEEKAGIIKSGVPVVCGLFSPEVRDVMTRAAGRAESRIYEMDPNDISDLKLEDGFPVFHYRPWGKKLRVNLRGAHQARNAAIALQVCEVLGLSGVSLDREQIVHALDTVEWPGRLHLYSQNPPTLLDCAHNPEGARSLAAFLEAIGWKRNVVLFTAMRDKRIEEVLQGVSRFMDHVVLTRVEPRSRCASQQQLVTAASGLRFSFEEDSQKAFDFATQLALENNSPVVVFGSIYLIGDVLARKTS